MNSDLEAIVAAEFVLEADDEERRLREATDCAVAERQAARARFRETRQHAAEKALAQAADLYARIIDGGIAAMQK